MDHIIDTISGPTRRQILTTAGIVAAAAAVTAACGSPTSPESTSSSSATGSSSTSGSSSDTASSTAVNSSPTTSPSDAPDLSTSDVPVGGGAILADRKVVVTQPTAGSYKAFSAVCPHQGCLVSDVSDGAINCNCHGSKFSATDGSVVNGPANSPLAPVALTVPGTSLNLS